MEQADAEAFAFAAAAVVPAMLPALSYACTLFALARLRASARKNVALSVAV
jgi:hypothetical protein